jgi:hypothetical protein
LLHEGLKPKTPIGLEKNGDEVDGVQKPNAHVALNQTQYHDGEEGDISPSETSRGNKINISGLLGVLHEVLA